MKIDTEYIFWDEIKNRLHKIHPSLTKSDLIWRNGSISDMIEIISSKLGITAKELKEDIDKL